MFDLRSRERAVGGDLNGCCAEIIFRELAHDAHEPESSLHSKTELASVALNANDALVALVEPFGPEVIEVSGAVVSVGAVTVQPALAGLASVLPAASVARTLKVCEPAPRALYAFGLVHDANEPESSLHS